MARPWEHQARAQWALLLLKPPVTPALERRATDLLEQGRCTIGAAEWVSPQRELIRSHYRRHAAVTAGGVEPAAARRFTEGFGESWGDVCAAGRVLSAEEGCGRLGLTPAELNVRSRSDQVRLAAGTYASRFADPRGGEALYVLNPFVPALLGTFEGGRVRALAVSIPADWEHFRRNLIGCAAPQKCPEGSLRRVAYREWQALGLPAEPDQTRNVVHASGSPIEALRETLLWLPGAQQAVADLRHDLVLEGQPELERWALGDPVIQIDSSAGGQRLFDAAENRSCSAVAGMLHRAAMLSR